MNAGIFGPYRDHKEVLQQIRKLKEKGYSVQEMTIVANTEERLLLEKDDKVQLKSLEEKHHFFQKVKEAIFFKKVKDVDLEEVQELLDVSDEEAELYYEQLKAGNVFLFIGPENFLDFDDSVSDFEMNPIIRIHTEGL